MSDTTRSDTTRFKINGAEHEFDITSLLNVEAIAIKRATGYGLQEWLEGLRTMDMDALTALVWVVRKRTEPELRYSDVVFAFSDLEVVDDEDEEQPAVTEGDDPVPTEAVAPPA